MPQDRGKQCRQGDCIALPRRRNRRALVHRDCRACIGGHVVPTRSSAGSHVARAIAHLSGTGSPAQISPYDTALVAPRTRCRRECDNSSLAFISRHLPPRIGAALSVEPRRQEPAGHERRSVKRGFARARSACRGVPVAGCALTGRKAPCLNQERTISTGILALWTDLSAIPTSGKPTPHAAPAMV